MARRQARAAVVLARLGGVRRVLHAARSEWLSARTWIRRAQRGGDFDRLPLRRAARLRRSAAHGGDPLRGDHVDEVVGPHADVPARQPAQGADGEWRPGGRPAGRLGGRGAHPLPRRRRGRHLVDRRRCRRVRRADVQRGRRDRPRNGRRARRGRVAAADDRRRARDALRRQSDQGLSRGGSHRRRVTSPVSSAT